MRTDPPACLRVCLVVLLVLAAGSAARAQRAVPAADTLRAADYDALTRVAPLPVAGAARSAPTATFELDLTGFPPEAEDAIAFAASIWATHVESAVPIRVRADFSRLDAQTLGAAGPACVEARADFPMRNTWYPIALADALLGMDLNPPGASVCPGVDIVATFNSELDRNNDGVSDWYFGTDGNTPPGRYDFATVVLHELGHGLGFFGSFVVATEEEPCPEALGDVAAGQGCWGIGSDALRPLIFDRFAEDDRGVPLLDTGVYPNPSARLGSVLQSGAVFFDGPSASTANEALPIDLYAPSSFEPGSSFSHLDEAVSPPGDPNSLMTPLLARAESIFSPGPFTCAIFRDIGWRLGPDCEVLLRGLAGFTARVVAGEVVLTFRLTDASEFVQAVVEQGSRRGPAPGDGPLRFEPLDVPVETLDPDEGATYTVVLPAALAPGVYTFRLRLIRADGSAFTSATATVTLADRGATVNVFPNPFSDFATVEVLVGADLIGGDRGVEVALYDVLGRRVARLFDGDIAVNGGVQRTFSAEGLAAGVYFVRVVGDAFSVTRPVTLVR